LIPRWYCFYEICVTNIPFTILYFDDIFFSPTAYKGGELGTHDTNAKTKALALFQFSTKNQHRRMYESETALLSVFSSTLFISMWSYIGAAGRLIILV
jgi:hypothetical protein